MAKLRFVLGVIFGTSVLLLAIGAAGNPPHPGMPHPGALPHNLEIEASTLVQLLPEIRAKALAARRMVTAPAKTHHRPKAAPNATLAQLGKDLFFDTNLSNPKGMSCGSCHAPAAGFTFPNSNTNASLGVAPGIVPGRFGNRKVPTIAYTAYCPQGPIAFPAGQNPMLPPAAQGYPIYSPSLATYVGGIFWDGRASDFAAQVPFPMLNPNEMDNMVHNAPSPALVVEHVSQAKYAGLFRQIFGAKVFSSPPAKVMSMIGQAIAAYEETSEVSPFSSKYDAYLLGEVMLTPSEMNGLQLVTGSTTGRPGYGQPSAKFAVCVACHGIPSGPYAPATNGPDLWSLYCYVNIGVPKNPSNPYYKMTYKLSLDPLNPYKLVYNPPGPGYVDLGLGDFLYPAIKYPPGGGKAGDFLAVNGTFKAPTLRNVAKVPNAGFVKAYMHNGVFKSLQEVVHFYNTRNLTTQPGEVIDFTQPNPYAGLKGKPLWPRPEFPSVVTLQNPTGAPGSINAQVGNLGLTAQDEADIVAFLGTLSDGFFK
jgi:cytochrome c peroxidase